MTNITPQLMLKQILSELDQTTTDIYASVIIAAGGDIITSRLLDDTTEALFSSVGKALFKHGNLLTRELGSGTIEQISLVCQHGLILARNAGQYALLFVLLNANPKLGLVIHATNQAAKKIATSNILQPGNPMGLVILNT